MFEAEKAPGEADRYLTTGVPDLDWDLNRGGYPVDRITEIAGEPKTGKTAMLIAAAARWQRYQWADDKDQTVVWYDFDRSLNFDRAEEAGIDLSNLAMVDCAYLHSAMAGLTRAPGGLIIFDGVPSRGVARLVGEHLPSEPCTVLCATQAHADWDLGVQTTSWLPGASVRLLMTPAGRNARAQVDFNAHARPTATGEKHLVRLDSYGNLTQDQ